MIDFHCHIDLYKNHLKVVEECKKRNMYVLSVTTTPSAWKGTNKLVYGSNRIRTALGLHPQLAHERIHELSIFDELIHKTRYVGEIGLDGSTELRPHFAKQKAVFNHILAKCSEVGGRIMSIHSRRASKEVLDELSVFPNAGIPILHWFSGSQADLNRAIEYGCWFSIGPMMFKSKNGRSIIKKVPKDKILTETDGPFAQINGDGLMPWQVELAINELSGIWELPKEEVLRKLHDNLSKLLTQN